jgi:hypothetical protein
MSSTQQHPFPFAPVSEAFSHAHAYQDGLLDQPLFERFERDNLAERNEARGMAEVSIALLWCVL